MNRPIEHYRLKKDTLVEYYGVPMVLKAGEICSHFGHSDTYIFQARHNIIPFFERSTVEKYTEWFEPVEAKEVKTSEG